MQPPRLATVAKVAAAAIAARLVWRMGKLVYNVLTSVPPAADLQHNCIPPKDFKHSDAATRAFIQQHYPELMDLVERGNLIVLQPAAMLADLLKQKQHQQQPAAFLAANEAAQEAEAPNFTEEDITELLSSPQLQHCLAQAVPEALVFVGTVHVAKQSADDVTRVIKVRAINGNAAAGCIQYPKCMSMHASPMIVQLPAYILVTRQPGKQWQQTLAESHPTVVVGVKPRPCLRLVRHLRCSHSSPWLCCQ